MSYTPNYVVRCIILAPITSGVFTGTQQTLVRFAFTFSIYACKLSKWQSVTNQPSPSEHTVPPLSLDDLSQTDRHSLVGVRNHHYHHQHRQHLHHHCYYSYCYYSFFISSYLLFLFLSSSSFFLLLCITSSPNLTHSQNTANPFSSRGSIKFGKQQNLGYV